MTVPENSHPRQAVQSSALMIKVPLKMTRCRSRNDFFKNQELALYTAIVQTHPDSNKISRSLRKIQNIPLKVYAMKRG
jgi:hypothetical protein